MKNKNFVLLFATLVNIGTLFATSTTIDGITYSFTIGSGVATLYDGKNCTGNITIPATITYTYYNTTLKQDITEYFSVTSIKTCAFRDCSSLTFIDIPNSVTTIGVAAFKNCSSLTSVTIPNGVTSIGGFAFSGCSGLTSIEIPNSVTRIEDAVFQDCWSLTSVSIPDSVTSIGYMAFQSCWGLTSVTIPNTVTRIGRYAFSDCDGLTSVTIPNSVTSIEEYAFDCCDGLTSIEIPNSVTSIGNDAFYGCGNLSNIYFQGSLSEWCESVIPPVLMYDWHGGNLYIQNSLLTQAAIPNGTTAIKNYTFFRCTSLTSVSIPESVAYIGSLAFGNCCNLDSLAIHCDLRKDSVGSSVFSRCKTSYLGLVMSDSTTKVKSLFTDTWSSLKEIELFPGSTCCGTPVGGNNHLPFMGNKSVEKITIPANIALIPDSTFMNCTKLKEVTLGLTEAAGGANTSRRISNMYKDGGYIDGESWDLIQETDVKGEVLSCPEIC